MGAALGAASAGLRPIAELMFVDFMGVCFGQIMNEIGKATYMSGGALKLPLVITASTGGGFSDAGQHSQTLHGLFAHVPGLKVVVPSNPHDAKGLMISAIRDDNPVVYLFHKAILGLPVMGYVDISIDDEVPAEPYAIPFGKARVVREGSDLTIVGLSQTVHRRRWLRSTSPTRASRPRSSTRAHWCRSTSRRSRARSPGPAGCWSWTRTT